MFPDDRFCIGDVSLNYMLWVCIMNILSALKYLLLVINVCHIYVGYTYDQCVVGYTLSVPDSAIVRARAWADFKLD